MKDWNWLRLFTASLGVIALALVTVVPESAITGVVAAGVGLISLTITPPGTRTENTKPPVD